MIRAISIIGYGLMLVALSGCATTHGADASAPPQPLTPQAVLAELAAGNKRFATGQARHPHADPARRADVAAHGQHPIAAVVACSDSRVPVELVLDQGIGDLFVIRVAGNVCATDETGSIEYAVEHLQTPLVVVMGHSQCGAVTAVVQHAHEHGNIARLVARIEPAVEQVCNDHPELKEAALLDECIRANVWHGIEDLFMHSPDVAERVEGGTLQIVGAVYDLASGRVTWLGSHPRQAEWLAAALRTGPAPAPHHGSEPQAPAPR